MPAVVRRSPFDLHSHSLGGGGVDFSTRLLIPNWPQGRMSDILAALLRVAVCVRFALKCLWALCLLERIRLLAVLGAVVLFKRYRFCCCRVAYCL